MMDRKRRRIDATIAGLVILAAASSSRAGGCGADLDGSGIINGLDLGILLANWSIPVGSPGCGGTIPCASDVNDDGVVDGLDLGILLANWNQSCVPNATDLAGNPLPQFPHFEFVRAFNQGEPIHVAIDPSRFSEIVGQSCDIYIVAARTAAQWQTDPSLTSVLGSPQRETFAGATIQANTFEIAGAATLSADAGTDIGVGYDVVFDCNRNGMLDAADAIDGLSDEAGLYVVHDLTQLGPLATTSATYPITLLTGLATQHRIFYPTDIASLGPRPLVVIGHGGGHQFTWYDFIQEHLASYGYVAISHPNTFTFGTGVQRIVHTTDGFLAALPTILGGALDGLVDSTRITWIGHSLGGQEAIIGVDTLVDRIYAPVHFTTDSIRLVSAIGANSLVGPDRADPHEVVFHMLYGSADGDIDGSAGCDQCQPLRHYDRARGFRHSTYVHGADHNDFNCCGFENFEGPPRTEIGRPEAQRVMKAVYLALHKHYVEDNIPAEDYLWRQWESFHPIGVADTTTVVNMAADAQAAERFVIDDFQTNPATTMSSSGGLVTVSVQNLVEDRLDDADFGFAWTPADPMNGMTYGGAADTTRGIVFDYTAGPSNFLEFAIVPAGQDFSEWAYLTFRACQGTRHPNTIAEDGDLTFLVTLIDSDGASSSINIGAYGGGIEEPYPRTGAGAGAGWQNEFETIRIRVRDFLTNGSGLNLAEIVAVRFEFAAPGTSQIGRLGMDDLVLEAD